MSEILAGKGLPSVSDIFGCAALRADGLARPGSPPGTSPASPAAGDAAHRPRRVLVVTNGWPTERHPEYAAFNASQVASLRLLGHDVGVVFVNARERGRAEYLRQLRTIARAAAKADVVHCFHGLSYLLVKLAGVRRPTVVSFQNAIEHEFAETPPPVRFAARIATRRLLRTGRDGAIFKDRVPDWLAANPLARHIANGVDFDAFTPGDKAESRRALGLDPDALYLLFASSKNLHRAQKRYDRFRAVLETLRARRPGADIREITLVNEPPQRVRLFYRAADAHVLTSEYEGSPNSVKEAMASALPVVTTDVGNVRHMAAGAAAARVVPGGFDENAFCDAVEGVLAADAEARLGLRRRLAQCGLEASEAAQRVAALYDDVIAAAAR